MTLFLKDLPSPPPPPPRLSFVMFSKAAVSVKISNLLIFFCIFHWSWPVLEKEHLIENVYIILSWSY